MFPVETISAKMLDYYVALEPGAKMPMTFFRSDQKFLYYCTHRPRQIHSCRPNHRNDRHSDRT